MQMLLASLLHHNGWHEPSHGSSAMVDHRDRIYAELGVPPEEPEDPLDRRRRMKAEREEPKPRERKLDAPLLTLDDVDQRVRQAIAAEHQFIMDILAET